MIVRGKEIRSVTRCTRCVAQQHLHSPLSLLFDAQNRAFCTQKRVLAEFICVFAIKSAETRVCICKYGNLIPLRHR